jgi:hypothetical protein
MEQTFLVVAEEIAAATVQLLALLLRCEVMSQSRVLVRGASSVG